ncbi:MAG: Crp/Fnr family transcriptional regulator [Rhodospirillales bacterium]|jgi:CRP-like cAMP-binding protein|nr:Crp/Fnr family transcriptional regulator [Rhodospirillaceae bacterium]MDP6572617.1 Crp/Fnr family transcriptional regulator [Rhodospirillales bacterium]
MARHTETLARIPVFQGLDEEAVRRLDTQCLWRRYDAEMEILGYKDDSSDVYFVAAGKVRVMIPSVKGKDTIFRDIDAGEFFGELAAIDGKERSASIVALTNATLARMPDRVFRDTLASYPPVCARILEMLVSRVRSLSDRVNEFRTLPVNNRVHAELLRLARPGESGGKEAIISPPPYHHEIAARVSTHREAVSRELKRLEREGLLEKRRGALVLKDIGALAELVERAHEDID